MKPVALSPLLGTQFAQNERTKKPSDSDQTGEVMRLFECLGNHRVCQHRENRAGRNGGCAGDDIRREMAEK